MAVRLAKPTQESVMCEVFRDMEAPNDKDNCHWVLFGNGTFYTFLKSDCKQGPDFNGKELIDCALELSKSAHLVSLPDNDCVTVMPFREFEHPTYVILSCLRQKIGWVIIGQSPVWALDETQEAAVGYVARARYELDCQENKIVATSFE